MIEQLSESPIQPQEQIQPIQETPVLPKKKFPLIVILLVVILFFGAGLVYAGMQIGKKQTTENETVKISPTLIPEPTETVDETDNWKTYTSNDLGISFQYPSNWVISPNVSKESVTFYPRGYVPKDHDDSSVFSCSSYGMGYEIDTTSLKQLPVLNLDSILYYSDSFGTIVVKPNLICVLDATNKIGEFELYKDDFIKILSTFKFIEENDEQFLYSSPLLDNFTSFSFSEEKTDLFTVTKANYGPPYDEGLYELANDNPPQSLEPKYFFAKSRLVDLSQLEGKKVRLKYREVVGMIFSEQQLVIVDLVE